jgi:predicted 3-demethylubiquinone-9 3-methyltransferase (glyoxalase superfamily)
LESLRSIYRQNASAFILKLFFDAKADEIVKIYSEAFPNEQARIITTLVEIDPAHSSKYQAITKSEEGGR